MNQLLTKAIDLYADKFYQDALLGFDEILKIDPGHGLAGEYKQKTLVNIDNARQNLILRSRRLADRNDYDGAINALAEALLYKPDDPMLLAEIDTLQNKKAAAKAAAKAAELKKPAASQAALKPAAPVLSQADQEALESKYQIGMEHFDKGDFNRATRSFLEIWTIDPEFHNVSTFLTKAYLLMGMQHYSQEQYEEAMDIWEKALKIDPHNIKAKRFLMKTRTEIDKLGGVTNG